MTEKVEKQEDGTIRVTLEPAVESNTAVIPDENSAQTNEQ